MTPLYTKEEFDIAGSKDLLPLQCKQCSLTFHRMKMKIQNVLNPNVSNTGDFCSQQCSANYRYRGAISSYSCKQCGTTFSRQKSSVLKNTFCSTKCTGAYRTKTKTVSCSCKQCGVDLFKPKSTIHRNKNTFCTSSCAATYLMKHRTIGTTRSKIEHWLEEQLRELLPDTEIHFNRRDAIGSELDIYFPKLKKAIEINGIFHYEPMFSEDGWKQIQENDKKKVQACIDNKIELVIIDVTPMKEFKPAKAQKYLDQICAFIDQ